MKQTKRLQWGVYRLLIIACLLTGLTACSTISKKDKSTIDYTVGASEEITGLLIDLTELDKQEPDCRYENFSERYRNLRVGLNTLALREQAKLQNSETIGMVTDLNNGVNKLVKLHRSGCLSGGEIKLLQKQFNSLTGNILQVENAKPQSLF